MGLSFDLKTINTDILYPWQRFYQIYALSELSNKGYQNEKWTKPTTGFCEEAWCCFETVECDCNDDLKFFKNFIGYTLINDEESLFVYNLSKKITQVCQEIGWDHPAEMYLTHPLWDELVQVANKALEIFLKNEEEAKKTCVYPWHLGEDPDEWAKKKAEKVKELEASKNQPS